MCLRSDCLLKTGRFTEWEIIFEYKYSIKYSDFGGFRCRPCGLWIECLTLYLLTFVCCKFNPWFGLCETSFLVRVRWFEETKFFGVFLHFTLTGLCNELPGKHCFIFLFLVKKYRLRVFVRTTSLRQFHQQSIFLN